MSRPVRRIIVFVILLLVVATGGTIALSRVGREEQPPCRACEQLTGQLPETSVCEMVNNPLKLAGKVVRVQATFRNDAGQLFMEDSGCTMHVGFNKDRQACAGTWRKLQITSGVNTWYDGSASIRVRGSISTIPKGNYYAGEEGFTISCLETVRNNPLFIQRLRFAIGRLFRKR
jgi:hypothetical protein